VAVAEGGRGAVASGHALGSAEALRVLQSGGNVVDAAIAGAMVLAVVLPYACGIGGDLYLLYHDARTGAVHGLNATGSAPSLATPDRFGDRMPVEGVRSATVPGVVRGWEDALKRFGTRTLRELLQSAIVLARDGFPAHEGMVENGADRAGLLARDAEAARLFLPGTRPHPRGATVVQQDLARSLTLIAEGGADTFYGGDLGRRFIAATRALDGFFTIEDLARHESLWQAPLDAPFCGFDVCTMPPNSLGVLLLLQLLALEADGAASLDPRGAALPLATERAWRWADTRARGALGDPRDAETVARALLVEARRELSHCGAAGGAGTPVPPASGDTSNLVIIDAEGNAVSLVQSVSGPYASGVVLPGTGILLNNRMRGFDLRPGSRNVVAPGRRPAHTLVPVLVRANGRVVLSIGTPGAAGQTITLAQVLVRVLACGQAMPAAISVPRWSVAPGGALIVERNARAEVIAALRERDPGLTLEPERHVRFGSVKAVWRDGTRLRAAADHRRVAAAAAF
jgi:gamma-glutamyltranspeptidase/glutathione hydrolase